MKIYIFYNLKNEPHGGANQFLKALQYYFVQNKLAAQTIEEADIILFNSHHNIYEIIELKQKFPNKIFIHRIDGPVFLIRRKNKLLDKMIYQANQEIADATIFQSVWSMQENKRLGIPTKPFETIIYNAPDPDIFNSNDKREFSRQRKCRIIATSWADNFHKGFYTYLWLDKNLNFANNEFIFCGNSPLKFENIISIPPLKSTELANELKNSDIYITASENDPCSNALIEALHCGLPAIALNSGGHPEIVKKAGHIFNDNSQIPELIIDICNNYSSFQENIELPSMQETANLYINFMQNVFNEKKKSKIKINKFSIYKFALLHRLFKNIKLSR